MRKNKSIIIKAQTLDMLNRKLIVNKIKLGDTLLYHLFISMGLINFNKKDKSAFYTKQGKEVFNFLKRKGWLDDPYCKKYPIKKRGLS